MLSAIIFAAAYVLPAPPPACTARAAPRMVADGWYPSCDRVRDGPLGTTWACPEPSGPYCELELFQGHETWMCYPPPMPSASVGDLLAVGGKKVGTRGTRQVWASHVRPTPGMNCEEEWINGELVWACYI